jgi:hypothetical protein
MSSDRLANTRSREYSRGVADASQGNPTPFERLERMTKQLLSVPKRELDARVEQAKQESKRRRGRAAS